LSTIFRATGQGELTVLHTFSGTDGLDPWGPLVQASDGNFYSTARDGGSGGFGVVYRVTPDGALTDIFNFDNKKSALGLSPLAGVVQATDGNLYGAASGGTRSGILFQLSPTAKYSVLHDFTGPDGANPYNSLFQHTNGTLYGATYEGGTSKCFTCGVVYSLNVGLGPFVRLLPPESSGRVGARIGLLGQGFTGAATVSFNGVPATFEVASDTYLIATVPRGANSGPIMVSAPRGTLTGDRPFTVVVAPSDTPAPGASVPDAPAPGATPSDAPPVDNQPAAEETGSPQPVPAVVSGGPPTAPPPAGTSSVPNALTDGVRSDVLAAVDRANDGWATAQKTLDSSALTDSVAGELLQVDLAEIDRLRSQQVSQNNVNTAFAVSDVTLDVPGHVLVRTRETWYSEISLAATGQLVRQTPSTTYAETYTVEYLNGGWIVTKDDLTPE
jgi:uncharacterized repeat protein (TIGR03803 family)